MKQLNWCISAHNSAKWMQNASLPEVTVSKKQLRSINLQQDIERKTILTVSQQTLL